MLLRKLGAVVGFVALAAAGSWTAFGGTEDFKDEAAGQEVSFEDTYTTAYGNFNFSRCFGVIPTDDMDESSISISGRIEHQESETGHKSCGSREFDESGLFCGDFTTDVCTEGDEIVFDRATNTFSANSVVVKILTVLVRAILASPRADKALWIAFCGSNSPASATVCANGQAACRLVGGCGWFSCNLCGREDDLRREAKAEAAARRAALQQ
jgi:hypothetical protein